MEVSSSDDVPSPVLATAENKKAKVREEKQKLNRKVAAHMHSLLAQLTLLLESKATSSSNSQLKEDPDCAPLCFISKWVDYSDKYGFGYQLSDETIGISFNDRSKMLMFPESTHAQYIHSSGQEQLLMKDQVPVSLRKKFKIFNYLQGYMIKNLVKAGDDKLKPGGSTDRVPSTSMWTWFRTSTTVVTVLTNGKLQMNNLHDHSKMILCPVLSAISLLEPNEPMKTYKFSTLKECGFSRDIAGKLKKSIKKLETIIKGLKLDRIEQLFQTELQQSCEVSTTDTDDTCSTEEKNSVQTPSQSDF